MSNVYFLILLALLIPSSSIFLHLCWLGQQETSSEEEPRWKKPRSFSELYRRENSVTINFDVPGSKPVPFSPFFDTSLPSLHSPSLPYSPLSFLVAFFLPSPSYPTHFPPSFSYFQPKTLFVTLLKDSSVLSLRALVAKALRSSPSFHTRDRSATFLLFICWLAETWMGGWHVQNVHVRSGFRRYGGARWGAGHP